MTYTLRIKAETVDEQINVLTILEKEGYIWNSKELPTKIIPKERYGKDYIYIEASHDLKKLATTDEKYENKSIEDITYGEFLARRKKVIL